MSEQGKHTPGPWAVHPVSARVDAFAGGMPLPVCELLWPTDERSEAETEANAHLIAAAPDLLKAAKEARAALQAFITEEPASEWMAVALLDHAIAKAEGRA